MRRNHTLLCAVVGVLLLLGSTGAFAHDFDRHYDQHPLRILAYPFHAVGIFAEFSVTRPIHWLASQKNWDVILGHVGSPDDEYWAWRVGP